MVLAALAVGAVYGDLLLRHGFSARENPSEIEVLAARTARNLAIPASYKSLKDPYPATPDYIQAGMAHFADHCATCHGNDGSGNTLFGQGLYPHPPDMRKAETQNLSDGELYYIIEDGVRLSGMPAFAQGNESGANDVETWHLVTFIRHLPQITPEEVDQMKNLNPKTDADREEEKQEQEFLNGDDAPK